MNCPQCGSNGGNPDCPRCAPTVREIIVPQHEPAPVPVKMPRRPFDKDYIQKKQQREVLDAWQQFRLVVAILGGLFLLYVVGWNIYNAITEPQRKADAEAQLARANAEMAQLNRDDAIWEGLRIEDGSLKFRRTDYGSLYLDGVIVNNTDYTLSYARVDFACYNGDNAKIDDAMTNTTYLGPRERWQFSALVPSSTDTVKCTGIEGH